MNYFSETLGFDWETQRNGLVKGGLFETSEDSIRNTLLMRNIGALMVGFKTFRRSYNERKIEAELRDPVDNLLRLVWEWSDLKKTNFMWVKDVITSCQPSCLP